jgi:hypothetical protein
LVHSFGLSSDKLGEESSFYRPAQVQAQAQTTNQPDQKQERGQRREQTATDLAWSIFANANGSNLDVKADTGYDDPMNSTNADGKLSTFGPFVPQPDDATVSNAIPPATGQNSGFGSGLGCVSASAPDAQDPFNSTSWLQELMSNTVSGEFGTIPGSDNDGPSGLGARLGGSDVKANGTGFEPETGDPFLRGFIGNLSSVGNSEPTPNAGSSTFPPPTFTNFGHSYDQSQIQLAPYPHSRAPSTGTSTSTSKPIDININNPNTVGWNSYSYPNPYPYPYPYPYNNLNGPPLNVTDTNDFMNLLNGHGNAVAMCIDNIDICENGADNAEANGQPIGADAWRVILADPEHLVAGLGMDEGMR